MKVSEALRKSAVAVTPDRSICEVAELMDQANVGAVAVLDGDELVGIVTDRDLVRRGMARRLAPDARVDSVMSSPAITIDADTDLHEAFAAFGCNAIRRLAVLRGGRFAGVVAVDDLLVDLAADLASLARPITAEVVFGHHDSPVPAMQS